MTTTLEKSLKREIVIEGSPYTLVITPEALHLAPKGRRKGIELRWLDLVSGEAALAVALNASLANLHRFPSSGTALTSVPAATASAPEKRSRSITPASRQPARSKAKSPARKQ
jgi:hypothetical protein